MVICLIVAAMTPNSIFGRKARPAEHDGNISIYMGRVAADLCVTSNLHCNQQHLVIVTTVTGDAWAYV